MYEDDSTNRMVESLNVWREVCNSKWLAGAAMILFLNKKDIFEEKIKKHDLNVCFPDYKGGKNFKKAAEYVKNLFLEQVEDKDKAVYPHVTCATDTENISFVLNAVQDIVVRKSLQDTGVL
jgi:hypothetical protein